MLVLIPTALRTISVFIVLVSPLDVFINTSTLPDSFISVFLTSDDVRISIPFFFKFFSSSFDISTSSAGTILSKNSTIVTFVPIEL